MSKGSLVDRGAHLDCLTIDLVCPTSVVSQNSDATFVIPAICSLVGLAYQEPLVLALLRCKTRKRTVGDGIQSSELFNALFHEVSQLKQELPPLCARDFEPPRGLVGCLRSLRCDVDVGFCAGRNRRDDLSCCWSPRQSNCRPRHGNTNMD